MLQTWFFKIGTNILIQSEVFSGNDSWVGWVMSYLEHGGSKMREAGRQLLHLQFGCGGEGSRRSGATHLCICCNYGTVRNCNCASHLKTRPRCSFFSLPPCRYWSSLPAWPYVAPMWGWRGVEGVEGASFCCPCKSTQNAVSIITNYQLLSVVLSI